MAQRDLGEDGLVNELIKALQDIARLAEKSGGAGELTAAFNAARKAIKNSANAESLQSLDLELTTWEAKLSVIMREPAGRNGMAHHCRYWIDKLKAIKP